MIVGKIWLIMDFNGSLFGGDDLIFDCFEEEEYILVKCYIRMMLYVMVMFVFLFGNSMVVWIVCKNCNMWILIYYLIVNMVVVDFLIIVFYMFYKLKV